MVLSAKERIAAQEQESSTSAMFEQSMQQHSQLVEHVKKLTEAQNESARAQEGWMSSQSEWKNSVEKRFDAVEKLLTQFVEKAMDDSEVKLADGSSVRKADVEALAVAKRIEAAMKDSASADEALTKEVRAFRSLRLDTSKLEPRVIAVLDKRLDKVVAERMAGLDKMLREREKRVELQGVQQLEKVTKKLDEVLAAENAAAQRLEKMRKIATRQGVLQVAAAMLPFALVIFALAQVLGFVGEVFGVGPLAAWAWSSFAAADKWYWKGSIAAATVAIGAGLGWIVFKVGRWVTDAYRGWL